MDQEVPEQHSVEQPEQSKNITDHKNELIRYKGKLSVILSIAGGENPKHLTQYYIDHREALVEKTKDLSDVDRRLAAGQLYLDDVSEAEERIQQGPTDNELDEEHKAWKTDLDELDEEAKFEAMDRFESESQLEKERRFKALGGLIKDTRAHIDKLEEILGENKK